MNKLWAALAVVVAALSGCTAPAGSIGGNVAIVVIDHLAQRPSLPVEYRTSDNCTYAPQDTNDVDDPGVGDDLPFGIVHGLAVQSRLKAELDATPALLPAPAPGGLADYGLTGIEGLLDRVERWKDGDREVTLIGLDSNGLTTGTLRQRIEDLVSALRSGPRHITRVVLNMSFVIVPCNVPAWLETVGAFDGAETLRAYEALLGTHPELGELHGLLEELATDPATRDRRLLTPERGDPLLPLRLRRAVSEFYGAAGLVFPLPGPFHQQLDSDPLRLALVPLAGSGSVVPVAAAGNGLRFRAGNRLVRTGYAFPFAPAVWDPVVSASGGDAAARRIDYYNNGEVVMESAARLTLPGGAEAAVHGSSFAAPRLSAKLAVYLLRGGVSPCDGHVPALGYADSGTPTGRHWDDLELNLTASRYCRQFAALASPGPTSS